MIIFISHPYASDPVANKKRNRQIINELARQNPQNIYLSPLLLFDYVETETVEQRERIMNICYRLIDKSDEVYIYGDSEGCKQEMQYAKSKHKKIIDKR